MLLLRPLTLPQITSRLWAAYRDRPPRQTRQGPSTSSSSVWYPRMSRLLMTAGLLGLQRQSALLRRAQEELMCQMRHRDGTQCGALQGLPAIATGRSMQANGGSGGASIARTGSSQQLDTAEGNGWETAWQGFQSVEAPDQAAGQGPAQAAAAQPGFTLLLPSREPPLPPAQLPGPSACSAAQHAGTATPGHSTLPAMRLDDRQKCMQFFKQVHVTLQAPDACNPCCGLPHEHQWHSQSLPTPARNCSAVHMGDTCCNGISRDMRRRAACLPAQRGSCMPDQAPQQPLRPSGTSSAPAQSAPAWTAPASASSCIC